uniref:Ovule protein n=1 Tax=Anisakis simplex TaxID=6269 RepID=A0A0M3J853_ANISI
LRSNPTPRSHFRIPLFLFALFNFVRILSFKFESMWLKSFEHCCVRQVLPGIYLNVQCCSKFFPVIFEIMSA